MLKKEYYETREFDNVKLYKTYSNEGYKIKQIETGFIFDEAIDVENSTYTYEETEELIEVEENIDDNDTTDIDFDN